MELVMETFKELINTKLMEYLPETADGQEAVVEAMKYSLMIGGKRLRPELVMRFAAACGAAPEKALPFACAVEMIHTYSLIHDDLPCMDDDALRRGQPSCHVKFGEDTALLAGDALLTLAFEIIADAKEVPAAVIVRCLKILSGRAGVLGMIGGQVIDLKYENMSVTASEISKMHALKTGALIEAACLLGCVVGGANDVQMENASEYAMSLGLAFQIEDDILDVTGDEKTLGKPVGSDAGNHKNTHVSLLGMSEAERLVCELTAKAIQAAESFGEAGAPLVRIAEKLVGRKS